MRILVSHVGYDAGEPKRAVVQAARSEPFSTAPLAFRLLEESSGARVFHGLAPYAGPVPRWQDWVFWSLDFSELRRPGRYLVELANGGARILADSRAGRSASFEIGEGLLLERTAPAVLRWFRSRRCAGPFDLADRQASFFGGRPGRVDVHGGWYDASGDYSKYLSHLSYANYLNPQHSPLAVWVFLACARLLADGLEGRAPPQGLREELLEEARYGAEFLRRMQDPAGYFYIGVFDRWTHEPAERQICAYRGQNGERSADYQAGYRQGGGLAIAALARAARELPGGGSGCAEEGGAAGFQAALERAASLQAAERGFAHLEAHNREYLDDGRENIIDDYCALLAAVELYAATGRPGYLRAARRRARALQGRLCQDGDSQGYWRANERGGRAFFHASDAGLPVIALLRYAREEPARAKSAAALRAACRSQEFELAITSQAANPFGYARQYVQPVDGLRRPSFFFPHHNESGYWWQGENARLASLAAAARLSRCQSREGPLAARLAVYAADQLGWILGCNPFDACFLHGFGRNNPEYEPDYPNAIGGICNGVTAGFRDEEDIDFLPAPYAERREHRWRWSEQWLPHAAWYLLAVCAAAGQRLGGR